MGIIEDETAETEEEEMLFRAKQEETEAVQQLA